jgi:hypothetical protein
MTESELLSSLMTRAFALAKTSLPLGFELERIQPTLAKLPGGPVTGLESLFTSVWPTDSFHTGIVEVFGPERINKEHDDLMPGAVGIEQGFIGIGGNGDNLFSYCIADRKVYLLECDYIREDAVYGRPWEKMPVTADSIKAIAPDKWESLSLFLEWAIAELAVLEAQQANEG